MVFSSPIFLFAFLPLLCILYWIIPGIRAKNVLLIIASLIFYGFGEPGYLLLLLVSVLWNYAGGCLIPGRHPKLWLTLSVIGNLALLIAFKYLGFIAENINSLLKTGLTIPQIALPVGISFFTFQGMSYVIDVYRKPEMSSKNFLDVLLYISFFPQLVAGPIVKYNDIAVMLYNREISADNAAQGLRRFIVGLSKKLLIADSLEPLVTVVYGMSATQLDARCAWIGILAYSLQIYFDFSGYSDMAIGLGRIFGFRFRENFDHPYASDTVRTFWRKWHISLSSWFKDYLYIPLGGGRRGNLITYRNLLIVFLLTGFWHGANWTFVVWGLWHGFFLILERSGVLPVDKLPKKFKWLGNIYTILVVVIGFAIFRADNLHAAFSLLGHLTDFNVNEASTAAFAGIADPLTITVLILGCILSLPVLDWIKNALKGRAKCIADMAAYPAVLGLFVLDILHLSAASYIPFIYFQF